MNPDNDPRVQAKRLIQQKYGMKSHKAGAREIIETLYRAGMLKPQPTDKDRELCNYQS